MSESCLEKKFGRCKVSVFEDEQRSFLRVAELEIQPLPST
jgi:hypothetical protein